MPVEPEPEPEQHYEDEQPADEYGDGGTADGDDEYKVPDDIDPNRYVMRRRCVPLTLHFSGALLIGRFLLSRRALTCRLSD